MLKLSGERVWQELRQILSYGSKGIELLDQCGYLETLLPEIKAMQGVKQGNQHLEGDVYKHTLMVLDEAMNAKGDHVLLMAALLHDTGKPSTQVIVTDEKVTFHGHEDVSAQIAYDVCSRLRMSSKDRDAITWLVQNHMRIHRLPEMTAAKRRRLLDQPLAATLLVLGACDERGKLPVGETWWKNMQLYSAHLSLTEDVKKPMDALKALGINGKVLMQELELQPGPKVGELLDLLLDALYEHPEMNKDDLLALAKTRR